MAPEIFTCRAARVQGESTLVLGNPVSQLAYLWTPWRKQEVRVPSGRPNLGLSVEGEKVTGSTQKLIAAV